MSDTLLTIGQVMERLKISYTTINRYIKAGRLQIVRVSSRKRYIKEQDLDRFIRENTGVYRQ